MSFQRLLPLTQRKEGQPERSGSWILNLVFYMDVYRSGGTNVEFTLLLDNALNHPQSSFRRSAPADSWT
jgi:hypothetical protein